MASQVKEELWGSWLRAEQPGRRIEEQREGNANRSTKGEDQKQSSRKPIPINLIRAFASLSVAEGNSRIKNGILDDNSIQQSAMEKDRQEGKGENNEVLGSQNHTAKPGRIQIDSKIFGSIFSVGAAREGAASKRHPRRYEDADVELSGFGETPDIS
ncbi:hypothetical protein PIB30_097325 [Stylosanthes scabra]|uniref:Uncharacterized protein n=1 Tax=Stylosanthes scabra TaxID=79078 RepID=A0ABU6XVI8_9FABA|nr:hypothetical protein [Stylosanthes scabra]